LSSQIHGVLGILLFASVLLWPELGVEGRTTVSQNKAASVDVLTLQVLEPLMAGRGGGGEMRGGECGVVVK
jgi:hypothetical protein